MPKLRSACAIQLGDVEFIATLEFPIGMLPLQVHVLQVWCSENVDELHWLDNFLNHHKLEGTIKKKIDAKVLE